MLTLLQRLVEKFRLADRDGIHLRHRPPALESEDRGIVQTVNKWMGLVLILITVKFTVFIFDSSPQVFLGDSMSYLATAMNDWIPPDRSFVYGFAVHDLTSRARSLNSLVAFQTAAGVATAMLTAIMLVRFLAARFAVAAAIAVLFAVEPQQLLYERFVLTESFSTALFALFVLLSFEYLRHRSVTTLVLLQVVGIVLLSFRVTFVPVVLLTAILAPLIAFRSQLRRRTIKAAAGHVFISLLLLTGLHLWYRRWNGQLSNLPPAYTYADGLFLLANVAPLVRAADADKAELAAVLDRPLTFANATDRIGLRNAEMFSSDGLIARIRQVTGTPYATNREAKHIAYRTIRRDPIGFAGLAARTYLLFYSAEYMNEILRRESGMSELGPDEARILSHYHLDANGLPFMKTLTRQYHLAAWPYYLLLLHTPLWLLASIPFCRRETRVFVIWGFFIATVQVGVVQILGVEPSPRHLHSAPVMLALPLAIAASRVWVATRRNPSFG